MKRATLFFNGILLTPTISIHALVKRATRLRSAIFFSNFDFNPRPREEGDMRIYAVAKGIFYFNPRPREEGDNYIEV